VEQGSVSFPLVRAGKVRAVGTSSFPASDIVEAQRVAERRGLARRPPLIDELVPRGTDVGALDMAYAPPAIQRSGLRSRTADLVRHSRFEPIRPFA
jgi:aryl-alcohol dehydrogenase-like predicted oxidoreductase